MIDYDVIGDPLEWCSVQLVQLDVVTLVPTVQLQTSRLSPFRVLRRQKFSSSVGVSSAGGLLERFPHLSHQGTPDSRQHAETRAMKEAEI